MQAFEIENIIKAIRNSLNNNGISMESYLYSQCFYVGVYRISTIKNMVVIEMNGLIIYNEDVGKDRNVSGLLLKIEQTYKEQQCKIEHFAKERQLEKEKYKIDTAKIDKYYKNVRIYSMYIPFIIFLIGIIIAGTIECCKKYYGIK